MSARQTLRTAAGNIHMSQMEARRKRPRDIILGALVATLFAVHIALILGQASPFWAICFPFTPLAPYVWPIVAIALAFWLIARAANGASSDQVGRWVRLILAILLLSFATDTLTGGDYRWFEIAMRREMSKFGGPVAIQHWAQQVLSSPQQIAFLEDHDLKPQDLPPSIQAFAAQFCQFPYVPQYRRVNSGGPWFMFNQGGADTGWGVIVGRADLIDPSPINLPDGRRSGWIKRLQPGVYLYAF